MRKLTKIISAKAGDFSELSLIEQELLRKAAEARLHSQAPYSKYWVGAAVQSAKNTIHIGCNVERCSYTQTTHAEQNAIDSMVAALGPAKIAAVALVAGPAGSIIQLPPQQPLKPISLIRHVPVPCGHCLQIIWENCYGDLRVKLIALASNGEVVRTTIGDAFPMRFGPNDLGIDYKK